MYNQLQQIKLFNKALDIFTQRALKTENKEEQTAMLLRAMKVILESLQDLERADSFARCVDNTHVWEKLARAQQNCGMDVKAHASFIMASHPGHHHKNVLRNASWNMEVGPGRGLINAGNTCYINAAIQCLSFCPPFAQGILVEEPGSDLLLFPVIRDVVRQILRKDKEVDPSTVDCFMPFNLLEDTNLTRIGDGHHYSYSEMDDSHAFLQHLVQALDEEMNKEMGKIFRGYLRSEIECKGCHRRTYMFQEFTELPLTAGNNASLESAMRKFLSADSVKRRCATCKHTIKTSKITSTIYVPPNALVVNLSTFNYTGTKNNFHAVKRKGSVKFRKTLEVSVSGPEKRATYELTGVIEHLGGGAKSGHYVAYYKTSDGSWFKANDSTIKKVRFNNFSNKTIPSTLLYTRKKNSAASGPWTSIRSWVTRAVGGLRDICRLSA